MVHLSKIDGCVVLGSAFIRPGADKSLPSNYERWTTSLLFVANVSFSYAASNSVFLQLQSQASNAGQQEQKAPDAGPAKPATTEPIFSTELLARWAKRLHLPFSIGTEEVSPEFLLGRWEVVYQALSTKTKLTRVNKETGAKDEIETEYLVRCDYADPQIVTCSESLIENVEKLEYQNRDSIAFDAYNPAIGMRAAHVQMSDPLKKDSTDFTVEWELVSGHELQLKPENLRIPAGTTAEVGLGQWSDFINRLFALCLLPVRLQFRLMKCSPFHNQPEGPRRKFSRDKGKRIDVDDRFEIAVLRMEVRRRMVIKKHFDDNAVKSADLRHF